MFQVNPLLYAFEKSVKLYITRMPVQQHISLIKRETDWPPCYINVSVYIPESRGPSL